MFTSLGRAVPHPLRASKPGQLNLPEEPYLLGTYRGRNATVVATAGAESLCIFESAAWPESCTSRLLR